MIVERPIIGAPRQYRGHLVSVHHCGPDLIVRVDGEDLPNFYLTSEAASRGAERYVDNLEDSA